MIYTMDNKYHCIFVDRFLFLKVDAILLPHRPLRRVQCLWNCINAECLNHIGFSNLGLDLSSHRRKDFDKLASEDNYVATIQIPNLC